MTMIIFIPNHWKVDIESDTRYLMFSEEYKKTNREGNVSVLGNWEGGISRLSFAHRDYLVVPWHGNVHHACGRNFFLVGSKNSDGKPSGLCDVLFDPTCLEEALKEWKAIVSVLKARGRIHNVERPPSYCNEIEPFDKHMVPNRKMLTVNKHIH
jgi:hypothetical protein